MSTLRCPTCKNRFDTEKTTAMPFCCERCRLIDLGVWLEEGYGLPHEGGDDDDLLTDPTQAGYE
ncbi:DNA gyrase inhibitor YacG [Lignipirellula cremea]|uniref:DNA gyrase inhibitor YacG n=1 Tax=Lignipirellula cremea TaxID=2528010 RepID=A0A518DP27_9BACT|nr:DNA gyrase inhibitor YacG [Lignipirellula cremea]QDU93591.1 DNA gyrase inhibitor YacG [Lignipirellula cremea]